MRLKNKVCLITGVASGMGRAAARRFAQEGAKVVGTDVQAPAGEAAMQEVKAQGGDGFFVAGDISRPEDAREMVRRGVERYGRLDVLYNNAGIFPSDDCSVINTEPEVWDLVYRVNLKGMYLMCRYGIPEIIRGGGGSVINIASFVALVGCSVPQDAYTSSKGAVIALSKSLAVQFGPKGVRCNAVCPGPVETPLLMQWLLSNPAEKAKRINRIPMGRLGKPEEIVALAVYLASDESAWTNGAAIVVDGGITANYF
ncbi:MAG: short-chain dehydrogenase [Elusimicrobia bacterium RIFCSPLOWO2_12_FULL_59_9]|nr:MAG: short-chain dehydrogenase [Elusimicrobia bacterium RIFCSPLOWO2_12_FULL_59_9]